ncbi:cytochrome c [Dinoroseobacter sp. PD6]|uniref:cytochrome c n=1 Tax=Dinoroseobacter sp. PD6 TaxID=3028384 RepID=UPI00237B4F76|nr:cytochrome c [Dinoroseobacter sp. PD6]MDD9716955.1 cytochrome c [Dinoroseobacter sp. PD6]
MKRFLAFAGLLLAAGVSLGLFFTRAVPVPEERFAALTGDAEAGEAVFHAAGCASCHAAPGASGEARLVLAGGQRFASPFGTFVAPNISPHPEAGIGDWSQADFASAVLAGVAPDGSHYYPAFPYTAYALMEDQDVADLWAYMQGLPETDTPNAPHELGFPFNIRRSVGAWKLLSPMPDWVGPEVPGDGRYLVEALAHCAECHTPRDGLGRLDRARWMAGAPNPSGKGRIPGITPAQLDWSAGDIAYYLETGFTPDFDSAGGHMASVITNMAQLTAADREAIAAYVKALQPAE